MQGEQIADTIEKLIDAKIEKQTKVEIGNWTDFDEKLNMNFVNQTKAELAKFLPKNVRFVKDPKRRRNSLVLGLPRLF